MSKSIKSAAVRKQPKPEKPYPQFPLFPHATGRWAKKVCGRIRFYGRWGNKVGPRIVPVEDVPASAAAAKIEFDRCWPYHCLDRAAPSVGEGAGCTIRILCNEFLRTKEARVETGELSLHSFAEYHRSCDRIIEEFGKESRVDGLRPSDFEAFRSRLARGCSPVTLKSKINRIRVVFKFASDNGLVSRPVNYGTAFDRPSDLVLRKARNEAGERMFEADELRKILNAADAVTKAMVLLGLNCGFGNTDISSLPQSAVDLDKGWVNFPRPKTQVHRRIPLWTETVAALRRAIADRPATKLPDDAGLCFITERGTRYVRIQESMSKEGHHLTINALARRFELLLDRLKIKRRKGVGFYTLRHVFETIAGGSGDQIAVDAIMGHVDSTMGGVYRERIDDERLKAVTGHVHRWLFPKFRKKHR